MYTNAQARHALKTGVGWYRYRCISLGSFLGDLILKGIHYHGHFFILLGVAITQQMKEI
jgi:hypothetical protein